MLPRTVVWHMFLRSFAIQGSWNYRTLQGSGFAYALMPVLRHVYRDGDALQQAVSRHTTLFNAHPYLSGVALGAVARMEADGEEPALIERFKTALRGSLGTLGDRIVWVGWRPMCVLLGIAVLLVTYSPTVAMVAFLVIYNTGHLALRWWGMQVGLRHGRTVGESLRQAPLLRWHEHVVTGSAFLLGLALPLIARGGLTEMHHLPLPWMVLPLAAVLGGWFLRDAVRLPALLLVAVSAAAGLLFSLIA